MTKKKNTMKMKKFRTGGSLQKIDLMKLSNKKACMVINAAHELYYSPLPAFITTRRKLLEQKRATEKGGILVPTRTKLKK